MRLDARERAVLRRLARMPFLDRLELASVAGLPERTVYSAVDRLVHAGLVGSVRHATDLLRSTRRFHLTREGVQRLAREEWRPVGELLRHRPLSAQWQRSLLERLDAVAGIYRLAARIGADAGGVGFAWYRSLRLDAALELPGGRTMGVLRIGRTADRTAAAKRVHKLLQEPLPGALLVLVPDPIRLRHTRRLLAGARIPVFLAVEADAVTRGASARIWQPPTIAADLSLRFVLEQVPGHGIVPAEPFHVRARVSNDLAITSDGHSTPLHHLPSLLTPAQKRLLDLVADWPWITVPQAAGMLGMSEGLATRLVRALEGFGLVGSFAPDGKRRLAVSDRGLALLAKRDRTSAALAKERFSVALRDPDAPLSWRNLVGRRTRQLLRNLEHTDGVHGFLAGMLGQMRAKSWEVIQVDPPHRSSRYFKYGGRRYAIHPDAFVTWQRCTRVRLFFLELERRAVRPVTMESRLAPYVRYYATHRPTDDHGAQPLVLVVFDDAIALTHFLAVAAREMARARVRVPLLASHRELVMSAGPLGPAWIARSGDPPGYAFQPR